nr:uncharacterized protein LOC109185201 [Ipomoea batatas]
MEKAMEAAGSPKSQELSLEVHESECEGGDLRSSKALASMVCQERCGLEGGDVTAGVSPSEAVWIPPPPNRFKCNVDAALYGDDAGFGLKPNRYSVAQEKPRVSRDLGLLIQVRKSQQCGTLYVGVSSYGLRKSRMGIDSPAKASANFTSY